MHEPAGERGTSLSSPPCSLGPSAQRLIVSAPHQARGRASVVTAESPA